MNNQSNYPIKVLDKSLSVLELLLQQGSAMNITEISEKLGICPSTIHRILDTLKHKGYIEQDPQNQKYQLGLKLLELGMAKFHQIDLINESTPFLKELVNQCNETVHLGILEQGEVVYLAKEESDQSIRMVSRVGKRASLYSTALGKVFLAYLPEDKRKEILDKEEFPSFTQNTINNKEELEKDLKKVREEGFALDVDENEKDVCCIAALSISSPIFRTDKNAQNNLKETFIETSEKISKRLGYNSKLLKK